MIERVELLIKYLKKQLIAKQAITLLFERTKKKAFDNELLSRAIPATTGILRLALTSEASYSNHFPHFLIKSFINTVFNQCIRNFILNQIILSKFSNK